MLAKIIFVSSWEFKGDFSTHFVIGTAYLWTCAGLRWICWLYCIASFPQVLYTGCFTFVNCAALLLPFLSPQLPAEVTSQVQRELCCPQTTHIITPEARAVSMTSSSLGTLVSIIFTKLQKIATYCLLSCCLKPICGVGFQKYFYFKHEVKGRRLREIIVCVFCEFSVNDKDRG